MSSTESPYPRFTSNEADPEQAGRVHGVVVPRVHLRPESVAAQQPAGGSGRDEAPTTAAALQQRLEPTLAADLRAGRGEDRQGHRT